VPAVLHFSQQRRCSRQHWRLVSGTGFSVSGTGSCRAAVDLEIPGKKKPALGAG
jgi:hypothetical protein